MAALPARLRAQQNTAEAVRIGDTDLGGVVTSAQGPEAGVWVIAETTDLPTKFARIVVTDDQGRYLIPDLPKAKYKVWVRGYGLVDSPKVDSEPGKMLNLTAVVAPNEAAAAQYYPAIYWYAMLKIPEQSQFGGKSDIPEKLTQIDWLKQMKNIGCIGCHQLGQLSTRTFPPGLGEFKSHEEAWMRRIQSGQSGEQMLNQLAKNFGGAPFKYYADWTERIAKGELPHSKPTRPQGLERNIVVTWWEWSTEKQYLHDLIASDRRYPTVNAYGPLFGSPEYSTDLMPMLDPKTHQVTTFKMPVRDPNMPDSAWARTRRQPQAAGAFALLGRRADLGHPGQQPQRHVRQAGESLVRGHRARHGQPGLLQEGLRPSFRQGVPARPLVASGDEARSQDDAVYLRRHLLWDASSAVRLRCQ